MDKVAGTTYYDILRATLTRSDPKEFLFFNRNAAGKRAAQGVRAATCRSAPWTVTRTITHQGVPDPAEGDQEVGARRAG